MQNEHKGAVLVVDDMLAFFNIIKMQFYNIKKNSKEGRK